MSIILARRDEMSQGCSDTSSVSLDSMFLIRGALSPHNILICQKRFSLLFETEESRAIVFLIQLYKTTG